MRLFSIAAVVGALSRHLHVYEMLSALQRPVHMPKPGRGHGTKAVKRSAAHRRNVAARNSKRR